MNLATKTTLSCLTLCLLASCGKAPEKRPTKNPVITEAVQPDGSNVDGVYVAKLWPVNLHLDQPEVGIASFQRENDTFTSKVHLKVGTPGAWHKQAIFSGSRCPTLSDDLNGDAYIDYDEAKAAMGQVLIPLDSNINSQEEGKNSYPIADDSGSYVYERSGSFDKLFADLRADDTNPNDNIAKLRETEGLGLEGKVVIIQGTTEVTFLPNSVSSPYGTTAQKALPVACGIIYKDFTYNPDSDGNSGNSSIGSEPVVTPTPAPTPAPTDDGGVITPPPSEDEAPTGFFGRIREWFRNRT